jgi:hypothetical protein
MTQAQWLELKQALAEIDRMQDADAKSEAAMRLELKYRRRIDMLRKIKAP